jgi:hypothetical protein
MLPSDWQEKMAAMIRGATPLDATWFAGGPTVTPDEQIAVYHNQYRLRIYDALAEELPGLTWMLGDTAVAVLWRYLDANPPNSWTLNRIAARFLDWATAEGLSDAHLDMIRVDLAVAASFEAAWGAPLSVAQLMELPPLRLSPHVRLLRLGSNVHLIRSAALQKKDVPALEAVDRPLLVFRRGIRVRHMELPLPQWSLLSRIDAGEDLGSALEAVVAEWPDVAPRLGEWFKTFAETDWVQVREG